MSFNSLFGLGNNSPDADLLGFWPLLETTGTQATDYSGNDRHGTIAGMGANPTTITGPNSWAASAFNFQGTDDVVSIAAAAGVSGANPRTVGGFVYVQSSAANYLFAEFGDSGFGQDFVPRANNTACLAFGGGTLDSSNSPAIPNNTWCLYTAHVPASATDTDDIEVYIDGVILPGLASSTLRTLNTVLASNVYLGANVTGGAYAVCRLATWFSFARSLSTSELAQTVAGPEPVNTVAPTVSGDTAQGSELTCDPGTWALPSPFASGSNGTVTYAYQWTRDGGDISGATSSTYTTQEADVGASVGCKVLASNDGGSDAAEETASGNTITVVASGGTTYRMNMRLFIPTQS